MEPERGVFFAPSGGRLVVLPQRSGLLRVPWVAVAATPPPLGTHKRTKTAQGSGYGVGASMTSC